MTKQLYYELKEYIRFYIKEDCIKANNKYKTIDTAP